MSASTPLVPCPDCGHRCSSHAEACPSCGRYFQSFDRAFKVIPGNGWSLAIFWGIMLAWIIPALIGALLIAVFLIMGIGAASLIRELPDATAPRR